MSKINPIDALLMIADDQGYDVTEQFDISTRLIGKKKAWKNLMQTEALELLEKIENGALEDEADIDVRSDAGDIDVTSDVSVVQQMVEYYDPDTGKMERITQEEYGISKSLQDGIDISAIITSFSLARMIDEERYKHFGYHSFKEYVYNRCAFGERQAKRYVRIGRRFSKVFNIGTEGTSMSLLENENADVLTELGSLDMTKLYKLASIPEEDVDLSRLPDEGIVVLKDGTELDLDQIKDVSAKSFEQTIDSKNEEIKQLKAQIRSQEEEINKVALDKERIEKEAQEGLDYAAKLSDKAMTYKMFERSLNEAIGHARRLNKAIHLIKGLPREHDALVNEIEMLHRMLDGGLRYLQENNYEALGYEMIEAGLGPQMTPEQQRAHDAFMESINLDELDIENE